MTPAEDPADPSAAAGVGVGVGPDGNGGDSAVDLVKAPAGDAGAAALRDDAGSGPVPDDHDDERGEGRDGGDSDGGGPDGPDRHDVSEADAADVAATTRQQRVRSAVEWVAVLGGAVVIALVVRTFLFTTFWIPSGSMEPTLMGEGRRDRVVVNRLAYRFGEPERGDIIVFEVPDNEPTISVDGQPVKDLIKRIVGLPGETVELRDGDVYIDGEKLDEPYLPDGMRTDPAAPGNDRFEVPEDAVFVLGDNRGASRDARFWLKPWVPEDDIVGEAFVRVWPLSAFGGI